MWTRTYRDRSFRELPWFSESAAEELVESVRSGFFSPRSRVLDVGCGAGTNLLYFARKGFDAYGVDLAPKAIEAVVDRARASGVVVHAQVGDALRLPFPAAWFDGAYDWGCFHALPIARRADYAIELARVLRRGAVFEVSWMAREQTSEAGPPHRPSLGEVVDTFEREFIFEKTQFLPARSRSNFAGYIAWLRRRIRPQPPRR